ncbi:MAG: thiol-activated cytolysin family protein [Nannocystaceae bacterium]|nr:thiol-activated cytolysin family protein [Nannocystaceae bacterium]
MSARIIVSLASLLAAAGGCATANNPVEASDDVGSVGGTTPSPDPDDDEGSSGDPEPGGSSDDGEDQPAGDADALDAYILGLGQLTIDPIADEHPIACPGVCAMWQEGEQTCTEGYLAQTVHFDTFIALQPNSPALWPGSIVRGGEVAAGFLAPVGLSRAPAIFSVSLENLGGSPVGMMEQPSLSSFREIRNQILAQGTTGATPAQISYDIETIKSSSQLDVSVGAGVDWTGVIDLDSLFQWGDSGLENKYLFDFTQTYYTVDLDTPLRPSGLFDASTTVDDAAIYMGEGNPPMYVQSISYGRRVLFGLETNESLEKVTAAVDAAVATVLDVDVDVADMDALTGSKITATVLGGDGDGAVKTVLGIEQLLEYITAGGNYSAESPGVPIAYKLAYLDNAPARLAVTMEYPEVTCQ